MSWGRRVMGAAGAVLLMTSPLRSESVNLLSTGFEADEAPPYVLGEIANQNGWLGDTVASHESLVVGDLPFSGLQTLKFIQHPSANVIVGRKARTPLLNRSLIPAPFNGAGILRLDYRLKLPILPNSTIGRIFVKAINQGGFVLDQVGVDYTSGQVVYPSHETTSLLQNGSLIAQDGEYHLFIFQLDELNDTFQVYFEAAPASAGPGGPGPGLVPLFAEPRPLDNPQYTYEKVDFSTVYFSGDTGTAIEYVDDLAVSYIYASGDMNCDGLFNGLDIPALTLAILDPIAYAARYPTCDLSDGDFDYDGDIGPDDVTLFVSRLLSV